MRHLSADRLAALADEAATSEEQAHLAACAACSADRDAHRRIVASAALERRREGAPLSDWSGIAAQLRRDGIIRTPADELAPTGGAVVPLPFASATQRPARVREAEVVEPSSRGVRLVPRWALRAAAAVVLVAGGAMAGRMTGGVPAGQPVAGVPGDSGPTPPTIGRMVDNPGNQPAATMTFNSVAHAQLVMRAAELSYQSAMQYLATHDTTLKVDGSNPVGAYEARLAALDEAVAATRRALKIAPNDPVMNSYYLSSVGAREATLKQIDDALPVNERVTRF